VTDSKKDDWLSCGSLFRILEPRIPVYGDEPEIVIEYEDGLLGRYETKKTVMRRKQIGTKVLKIPIFKQKTFTLQTMEEMKNHLEGKAMKEVLRLDPPPPKE